MILHARVDGTTQAWAGHIQPTVCIYRLYVLEDTVDPLKSTAICILGATIVRVTRLLWKASVFSCRLCKDFEVNVGDDLSGTPVHAHLKLRGNKFIYVSHITATPSAVHM